MILIVGLLLECIARIGPDSDIVDKETKAISFNGVDVYITVGWVDCEVVV